MRMIDLKNQRGADFRIGDVTTSRANFTRDVQEQIVSNYLDPFGYNHQGRARELYSSRAGNDRPQDTTQSNSNAVTVNRSELERLQNMERLIQSGQYNPGGTSPQSYNERVQQAPAQVAAPQSAVADTIDQNEDPIEKLMREFNQSQNQTPAPQPGQDLGYQNEQPSQPQKSGYQQAVEKEALLKGYNPNEVAEFVKSISPSEFVMLYESYKQSSQQPQQPPQQRRPSPNIAEAPSPSAVSTCYNMPRGRQQHPFF